MQRSNIYLIVCLFVCLFIFMITYEYVLIFYYLDVKLIFFRK